MSLKNISINQLSNLRVKELELLKHVIGCIIDYITLKQPFIDDLFLFDFYYKITKALEKALEKGGDKKMSEKNLEKKGVIKNDYTGKIA